MSEVFVPQHLYAIRMTCGGPIKIGKSVDPPMRRRQLATAAPHPLVLLGYVPETDEINEANEHARLADRRIHLEWFDVEPHDLPWLLSIECRTGPVSMLGGLARGHMMSPIDVSVRLGMPESEVVERWRAGTLRGAGTVDGFPLFATEYINRIAAERQAVAS